MKLEVTNKTDFRLSKCMENHYSSPKGFVGRSICYAIIHDSQYYGHIIGGSATKFLPNRNEFLGISSTDLNMVVNNIFFHIFRLDGRYPYRNFVQSVLEEWENLIVMDWFRKYGDKVIGLESLVEPPRTGEVYKRLGWKEIGKTKGYTCKRVAGKGTDSWTGKRVWNTKDLHPKLVFAKKVDR